MATLNSDLQLIPAAVQNAQNWRCVPNGPMQNRPCPMGTSVVIHGPAFPVLGQISNTVPENGDLCADPNWRAGQVCKDTITVGLTHTTYSCE